MKTLEDIVRIQKRATGAVTERVSMPLRIRKVAEDKRLVYGEVYAPNVIDTHGDMMIADDVILLCHRFMLADRQAAVDVMHNNKPINAKVVESFIADGHPEYTQGAWVAVTKILDDDIWEGVKDGVYNGYSVEMYVRKQKAIVEYEILPEVFGMTEKALDHDHVLYVKVDDQGRVVGGHTSIDNGHFHLIRLGTATEDSDGHSHRYFLP